MRAGTASAGEWPAHGAAPEPGSDDGAGPAPAARARIDKAAYGRARAHSRRVRLLKVVVPAVVAVIGGAVVLVSWLDPFRALASLPIQIDGVVISGTRVAMEAPRLSGYTRDNRAYEVSATAAAQDLTKPGVIELSGIRAMMDLADDNRFTMSATTGLYENDKQTLTLETAVNLDTTQGYAGRLTHARIDFKAGTVVSERPVDLKLKDGTLRADRMEVSDRGHHVIFRGNVEMTLIPNGGAAPAPAEPAQADPAPAPAAASRTLTPGVVR